MLALLSLRRRLFRAIRLAEGQSVTSRASGDGIRRIQVALVAGAAFVLYALHRARFVGGCDGWAYFAQAQLFLGLDPGLHSFADPLRHAALTPHCMQVARGGYVSPFPPGYSLLLALAGLFGGEYWLNPVLGAFSIVLVYLACSTDVRHGVALVTAAVWATCPLVVWYVLEVDSDFPATFALLVGYVLLRRGRLAMAGVALGLSLVIRPTNACFLPAAALLTARRAHAAPRFIVGFAGGTLVSLFVAWSVWGAFLSPDYRENVRLMSVSGWTEQVEAYALEAAGHLGPVLVLSAWEVVRRFRRSGAELCWFLAFFAMYSVVHLGIQVRFILPAYPAAFVLAARSAQWVLSAARSRWRIDPRIVPRLTLAVALAWGAVDLFRVSRLDVFHRPARNGFCDLLAQRLPKNALVGTFESSGELRTYAGVETFVWLHPDALSFARDEWAKGRPLYLLFEPHKLAVHAEAQRFVLAFDSEPVPGMSPGFTLRRVRDSDPRRQRLPLADPVSDWAVLDGFAEIDPTAGARLVRSDRASLQIPFEHPQVAYELELEIGGGERGARLVELRIGDRLLGRAALEDAITEHHFRIPRELVRSRLTVVLDFPGVVAGRARGEAPVARVRALEMRAD